MHLIGQIENVLDREWRTESAAAAGGVQRLLIDVHVDKVLFEIVQFYHAIHFGKGITSRIFNLSL